MEIQIDVPKCHLESIFQFEATGSELGEVITRKIPLASTMTPKYYKIVLAATFELVPMS